MVKASNPSLLPLNSTSPSPLRTRARAAPDHFQAHLQGRLASRLNGGKDGSQAEAGRRFGTPRGKAGTSARSGEACSKRQAELAACLTQLGVPPAQAKTWLAAATKAVNEAGAEDQTSSSTLAPRLEALVKTMEASPGQALKVPASRLPEVASLLREAGIPGDQVERLLSSPGVQEKGLTVQAVRAAWIRSNLGPPPAAATGDSAMVTSHPAYQRLWGRLAVPAEAVQDLELALKDLGVPQADLSGLEEQARQGPIPLSQIWKLLGQGQGEAPPASAGNAGQVAAAPADPNAWLKLLVQAGLPPQVAQTLLGQGASGGNGGLRERLLTLAPPAASPAAASEPKPLYLPQDLRLQLVQSPQGEGAANRRFPGGQGKTGSQDAALAQKRDDLLGMEAACAQGPDPKQGFVSALAQAGQWPSGAGAAAAQGTATAAPPYLTPEVKEGLWAQLQAGVVDNLRAGENRVSLQLSPPELGEVQLTLNLKGEFVQVVAVTARPEVAQIATAQVQQLVQALNQQGLILSQFQVQIQEAPGRQTVVAASGQRDSGRRETESGDGGKTMSRRRSGQLDFFV